MKPMFNIVTSLLIAIVTTLIFLTVNFMIMLFSSGDEGYRTTYFNSLFFENVQNENGGLSIEFGVANGLPIILSLGMVFKKCKCSCRM